MKSKLLIAIALSLFAWMPAHGQVENPPASLNSNSPSSPGSSLVAGFNVRNYGAKGDTQLVAGATFSGTAVTCNACTFVASDVGKQVWSYTAAGVKQLDQTTITVFTDLHHVTVGLAAVAGGPGQLGWGTDDTTAIATAATAAFAAAKGVQGTGNTGVFTAAPMLYFPAGGYTACNVQNGAVGPANIDGLRLEGDGIDVTFIYSCGAPTLPASFTTGSLINANNVTNFVIRNITLDGNGTAPTSQSSAFSQSGGSTYMEHVRVYQWNPGQGQFGIGINVNSGALHCNDLITTGNGSGIQINHGNITGLDCGSSNNAGSNIAFFNTSDSGAPFSSGQRLTHFFDDECGTSAPTVGGVKVCFYLQNADDVICDGCSLFAAPGQGAVGVDVNSVLYLNGGQGGPFTGDTNSSGIINRGRVQAANFRAYSTGTGVALDNTGGSFLNIGGNHFGQETPITSASDTASVCTIVTSSAHGATASQIGQQIHVINSNVTGYNGMFTISAVPSATQVSYPCAAGLGAATASGFVQIDGIPASMTGNAPISSLTHSANTFVLGGTIAAVNFGNQTPDEDIVISKIQAISTTSTTCAVAPVITFTQGGVTATLTLTTGKTVWDSAVDASTGLPVTFFQGTVFTASTTAGTCVTPPTNLNVTYTWQSKMHP
jgi:hypothetical protein